MRSNDTILLENAYEQILKNQFLKEEHDDFKFKGVGFYSDLKDALGEDIYSLPIQNFYDAIEKGNLKEGSWYVHSKKEGYEPKPFKIVKVSENGIFLEDEDVNWLGIKEIAPVTDDQKRKDIKYRIYNPKSEDNSFRFGLDIYPNDLIIGPIENKESIIKLEKLMKKLESRTKSMAAYYDAHPNAPMD